MNEKNTYKDLMYAWVIFDFIMPIFFIVIYWPVATFVLNKSHGFDRIFHSADLMPLGAILLLSAIRELETESQLGRIKVRCQKRLTTGHFLVVIFLFMYAICKYYSLTISIPEEETTPVNKLVSAMSFLSISTIFFCGFYSFFLKSTIYKNMEAQSGN